MAAGTKKTVLGVLLATLFISVILMLGYASDQSGAFSEIGSFPLDRTTTSTLVSPTFPDSSPGVVRDQFLGAGIAFNTPSRMKLEEATTIQLVLGQDVPGADLEGEIEAPGERESASIETTCATTARLRGQNFEIEELTEAAQYVCAGTFAEWRWHVTPLKGGPQRLTLSLTAAINDNPPSTVEVFEREIEVEVSFVDRFIDPVVENLGVSITAFLTAIGAAAGTWMWTRIRRKDAESESSS